MTQARIPTLEDLGGLPNIDPRERRIGSYSLEPLTRGAQALTKAGEQAGNAIEKVGQAAGEVAVSRDRNDYATAHAEFLANKINFESSLAKDQDYTTLEKRYTEGVNGLAGQAAQHISNPRLREHFMGQVQPDIERGIATFKSHAEGLEGNADVANTRSLGDTFMKQAAAAPSSDTRRQIIDTYTGKIDALAARGRISATDAEAWKRGWVGQFALADGEARIDRGDAQGVVNELRAKPVTEDQVTDRILHAEGVSKNPNSSSLGFGGWTKGSWLEKIRQYRPDLAAGKSDEEILDLRNDRNLGREMTAAYARENAGILAKNGIEATPGNVYLGHFLGPAGAVAVAKADPQRPVIDVLTEALGEKKAKEIVEANRSVLQGKLAGSVTQWSNGLMGGSKGFSFFDVLPLDKREMLRQRAETKLLNTANEDAAAAKLDQYNLKASIADDLTSMTNTGKGVDSVPGDRVSVVLGGAAYQKWQDDRNDAHQVWSATHDLPTLPEADIQSRLNTIMPVAGEDGYARKQAVHDAAKEKADAIRKSRRDDPAGSMADDPAVKAAVSAYDKNKPDTFKAVVAARMAAQERAGLEEEYRSPITKQEALELTAPLRTMLPGQERQVLTELGEKFEKMFGPDADTAFAYAIRAHKVDAETAQIAARVMRKLGLGQAPTEGDAQRVDQVGEVAAADRTMWQAPELDTWVGRMAAGVAEGTVMPSPPRPEPFGPNLPDVKPRAIAFLLQHPETAAAFDKEYAQPGLAKKILEKYSAAAGAPNSLLPRGP